ncbi:type II secretion system protein [Campylobacter geochelonis]|uniref:N-terminal methylation domain-containing protein n=1 Tax=Campylobacter geochelonis TaxID=1780362 RepID=A0A128EGY3_9BACT|nr:type II secretion system GspH family protein [Campylobacter geochelonis]QKF71771.1 type II secretion/transformation system, G protein [Campylobacter geochelonis]CZE47548.1 N-terminal methylation domain-containing protein [Campylobacter geochelonis]CZE48477.1 N-terminal methylation domain-containing protein [Campylobacter geochelonis]CZE51189.1 N-terminal methylation domain-containing protein [Campylobacter geochelonis]
MKRAFSMIELIFIIAILGILAAVALPRLSASRDDALVASAKLDLKTALSDVITYNLSQGRYSRNIKDMTNVDFKNSSFSVKGVKCLKFSFLGMKVMQVDIDRSGLCDRVLSGSVVEPYLKMDAGSLTHTPTVSYIPLDESTISSLNDL